MAFGRVRLYHRDCRKGKVFDNEKDYLEHFNNGWVDFPTKIDVPDPPVPVEATPDPIQEAEPEPRRDTPVPKPKKPGRPSKKVKGGK